MSDPKCAEMLLRAAGRDLLTLRGMAAGVPDESFGFHVQQAAEKAFKAWLCLLGETYPLTHNLEALMGLLAAQGIATPPFRTLIPYTPYAVEFRCEGVGSNAGPIDREEALVVVEALLARVRAALPTADGA